MAVEAVVVDASALAALLFGEPSGPEMASRMNERGLFAPTLIRYELASVCLKKVRAEPEMHGKLRVALGLYSRLGVREVQVPPDVLPEVAWRAGLTTYDAAYLWLARELGAELLTLDRSLQQALRRMPGPMRGSPEGGLPKGLG
jgi:predicted nucleic acid-binding protein